MVMKGNRLYTAQERPPFILQRYIDPRNVHHAEKEALTLLATADSNQDGVLTLPEVLAQSHMFMASKMVDAARSFHDEF